MLRKFRLSLALFRGALAAHNPQVVYCLMALPAEYLQVLTSQIVLILFASGPAIGISDAAVMDRKTFA